MKRYTMRRAGMIIVAAIALLAAGCDADQATQAAASDASPQLTIAYIDWAEDVAVSQLVKVLLERHFDYRVRLNRTDVEGAFGQVADGDADVFLDVWLPDTHKPYWERYGDRLSDLGAWYSDGATLGIAVPD